MSRNALGWCRAAFVFAVFVGGALASERAVAQPAGLGAAPGLLVPGGTAPLLEAAGIRVPVERDRALGVLVRAVYGPFAPSTGRDALSLVLAALAQAANDGRPSETVPGLLPPAVWQAVLQRPVPDAQLAAALVADKRAAFLYLGLFSLDDDTLGFFASHPELLISIYRQSAAAFALYADGLRIAGGHVQVPGGADAVRAWERALGAPRGDPSQFVFRLMERNEGRLGELFQAIGRLDPPHLAFALGPSGRDLPALIDSAANFDAGADVPFVRWSDIDVPFLLEEVRVTPEGRLARPAGRTFWEAALRGEAVAEAALSGPREEVTAPWLVARFGALPRGLRRVRFDATQFAQRRFAARFATGEPGVGEEDAWLEPATKFAAWQTLLLTLEQMGVVDPVDYRGALEGARAVTRGFDPPGPRAAWRCSRARSRCLHSVNARDRSGGWRPAAWRGTCSGPRLASRRSLPPRSWPRFSGS